MNLVEHIGSGIKRIRDLCREYEVGEQIVECTPNWVTVIFHRPGQEAARAREMGRETEQVTEQVIRLIEVLSDDPANLKTLMARLELVHRPTFLYDYIKPALAAGCIEMTIPEKPNSSKQKYRLKTKRRQILKQREQKP